MASGHGMWWNYKKETEIVLILKREKSALQKELRDILDSGLLPEKSRSV